MAKLSITAAADFAGKARSTIQRSIKNGTLSATVDATGVKTIDTSELLRVFGEPKTVSNDASQNTPSYSVLQETRLDTLQEKLQAERDKNAELIADKLFLKKMIEKQNAQIEIHSDQLDSLHKQINKLSNELSETRKPKRLLTFWR